MTEENEFDIDSTYGRQPTREEERECHFRLLWKIEQERRSKDIMEVVSKTRTTPLTKGVKENDIKQRNSSKTRRFFKS